jgi:hypothetical protein
VPFSGGDPTPAELWRALLRLVVGLASGWSSSSSLFDQMRCRRRHGNGCAERGAGTCSHFRLKLKVTPACQNAGQSQRCYGCQGSEGGDELLGRAAWRKLLEKWRANSAGLGAESRLSAPITASKLEPVTVTPARQQRGMMWFARCHGGG